MGSLLKLYPTNALRAIQNEAFLRASFPLQNLKFCKLIQKKLHLIYSDEDEIVATFEILNWEMSHLRGKQTLVKRKLSVHFWDHF